MEIIEIDSLSDNFTSQETSFQDILHDSSQDIQDSSQNIQDTSQNIHDQITKVKKLRSIVHDYFTLNTETNRYKCNHCDRSYKVPKDGSTSTLKKHLKEQHNDLFSGINQITDAMNELEISNKLVYILFYFILMEYHIIHICYLCFLFITLHTLLMIIKL